MLADWQDFQLCTVGTPCSIQRLLVNDSAINITGASCNITIRNTTSVLINGGVMTEVSAGYYNYTFTPNRTGTYPSNMRCAFATELAVSDVSFVAERGVSRFMGFELAIPLLMLGIAGIFLWGHFKHENKNRLVDAAIGHGTLVGTSTFCLLAIILAKHFVEFENASSNAVLTRIDNLLGTIYIASIWVTAAFVALIMIHFAIQAVVLIKQAALEKKKLREDSFDTEW